MRRAKHGARYANRVQEALIGASVALLRAPIEHLNLPLRAQNRLAQIGVSRVGDLVHYQDKDLLKVDGFGLSSLRELHAAIDDAIARHGDLLTDETVGADLSENNSSDQEDIAEPVMVATSSEPIGADLFSIWNGFLAKIPARSRDVIIARMGGRDRPLTLEALGRQFGLTRERVRQVQQKVMVRFQLETGVADRLADVLTQILSSRSSPLYLATLPAEDSWFQHVRNPEALLDFLIDHLLKGKFGTFKIHGRGVVSRCSLPEWERKLHTARSFVADNSSAGLTESALKLAVGAIAGVEAEELQEELWRHATTYAHFAERDGERILVAHGRGVDQMVTMVLESSCEPLHYREIAARVERAYGVQDVRRVHNSSDTVGYLLGRGVYGLRRHIPVSVSEGRYLASLCESLVKEGPIGRQWHTREMLADIEDQEPLSCSLSHYDLSVLLQTESDLHYAGRQIWTAKTHGRGGVHARIDIRNAIEAALEEEGKPMAAIEIHRRISTIRGLGNTFQVHPRGRLIRVGPAMWGLSDRDVDVACDELAEVLNKLYLLLSERGRAFHVSELLEALRWRDKDAAVGWQTFGVAQVDSRFRCFAGDYLGLAGWTATNRISMHEAIAEALPVLKVGASVSKVQEVVEAQLERGVSTDLVRAALRGLGASYDRLRGVWTLAEDFDLEDDETSRESS
ncbi:MAG: hypothetical protein KF800_17455 [Lysobacter sp.]|nr:hypothetical protein [Lysobacter sp.]